MASLSRAGKGAPCRPAGWHWTKDCWIIKSWDKVAFIDNTNNISLSFWDLAVHQATGRWTDCQISRACTPPPKTNKQNEKFIMFHYKLTILQVPKHSGSHQRASWQTWGKATCCFLFLYLKPLYLLFLKGFHNQYIFSLQSPLPRGAGKSPAGIFTRNDRTVWRFPMKGLGCKKLCKLCRGHTGQKALCLTY